MKLITTSVLTLLALYVLYSEPIKLPPIVKKNKKLCYILIIGSYLYYHRDVEPFGTGHGELNGFWLFFYPLLMLFAYIFLILGIKKLFSDVKFGIGLIFAGAACFLITIFTINTKDIPWAAEGSGIILIIGCIFTGICYMNEDCWDP